MTNSKASYVKRGFLFSLGFTTGAYMVAYIHNIIVDIINIIMAATMGMPGPLG